MKRAILIILAFLMLFASTITVVASDSKLVLAEYGTTSYRIVISSSATETEVNAAHVLADHLYLITKAVFSIVRDTEPESTYEILVGNTNRENNHLIDRTSIGEEGIRIFTSNQKLFLTGGADRGTVYAVYTFLEKFLGCRWFTKALPDVASQSDCIVIPEIDILSIGPVDYTFTPPFQLRQTYWMFSTIYPVYSVTHKLHGVMAGIPESLGGIPIENCINSVHTMGSIITADMFASHPEYFGMDANGVRQPNRQPCFSNEDVLNLTIAAAKAYFARYTAIFSVSQNDNQDFCECSACVAFNNEHGGVASASLLNFVNKVAREIRKDYPERKIETLAYQLSEAPPTGLTVEENVVIRLCAIQTCVLHDLDDSACPDNKEFDANLTGWSNLTENIYIWDYSTNFQYIYAFFPNVTAIQSRYQYFRDRNIIAIFDHGCGENIVPAELHELRTYLVCKLLWDPETDVNKHIKEFCDAYYGNASNDVIDFIYYFEDAIKGFKLTTFSSSHISCYDGGVSLDTHASLSEFDVVKLDRFIEKAKSKNLTDCQKDRLEGLELSWRFFKNATWSGEFNWLLPWNDPAKESQKLYNDMKNYGIGYLAEAGSLALGNTDPNFHTLPTFWYHDKADLPIEVKLQSILLPIANILLKLVLTTAVILPPCWLFWHWKRKNQKKHAILNEIDNEPQRCDL